MSIEVDPTILLKPEDSDYNSSGYDTSTASLTSSVNQYLFENGRQYHAYYGTDKYLQPTDETEQDRLDLHHEILRLAFGETTHEAPLKEPHHILDIGTGTGIWAIDMADQYPMAEVIGTDLSPIQPSWVPANCRFEVDDAMAVWTYQSDFFDLVHSRNISSGVTNWNHLISEMMRCTKPGGYVELGEADIDIYCDDGSMKSDNPLKVYIGHLRSALSAMQRTSPTTTFLENLLKEAGFEDIKTVQAKEPIGPWAKDPRMKKIGAMSLLHSETVYESYGMAAFTRVLGMGEEEARNICNGAVKATKNKNYHVYGVHYRVCGRKPVGKN
ncbi:Similar to Demethylmenaquinone methyltransferase; acc. no. Q9RRT0.1 [Pyronema omphalodes CBS 100304]|uniref:Similar to Demethylmenaquinone methyltransferase acc. no. Q9RRT0.1 n=1 Tax=Pyronema omphalodes (strain CBS 100304) TaxID=1076935 RepID=U4L718_PYROM|nr:Similar to Demethylmenaquinone methyltransferase; acc. no. Q9RRT0.1 [Pyronema omphalodes CBS 100304]